VPSFFVVLQRWQERGKSPVPAPTPGAAGANESGRGPVVPADMCPGLSRLVDNGTSRAYGDAGRAGRRPARTAGILAGGWELANYVASVNTNTGDAEIHVIDCFNEAELRLETVGRANCVDGARTILRVSGLPDDARLCPTAEKTAAREAAAGGAP